MAFQSGSQSVRLVNKSFVVEGLRKCDLETTRVQPRFFLLHIAMHGGLNCRSKLLVWRREAQNFTYLKGLIKITLIDKAVLLVDRSQTEVKLKI